VGILKLVEKETGIVVAQRQIRGTEEEAKLGILADLVKRWNLRWIEDDR